MAKIMETIILEFESVDELMELDIADNIKAAIKETVVGMAEADYRHSCEGKVKYGHLNTAIIAAEIMGKKINEEFEAYPCRHCEDAFHIGHKQVSIEMEL